MWHEYKDIVCLMMSVLPQVIPRNNQQKIRHLPPICTNNKNIKLCDYTAFKNNIAVSTASVFIDPRHNGYYELNAIDLENICMVGKIIHVKKQQIYF